MYKNFKEQIFHIGVNFRNLSLAGACFVACLTFLVYLPSLNNGFVNWDDDKYVYENHNIRVIDLNLLNWSFNFTDPDIGHWCPLTWISLASDYAVWGLEPWGFHLTNILLHSVNTFLVFILVNRLIQFNRPENGKGAYRSLFSGALTSLMFGIHPLHVESVAWVTERKDVLSVLFFLICLLNYVKYNSGENFKKRYLYYCASLIFFSFALMAKSMAITLPILLLLLDYYPLKRFTDKGITDIRYIFIEKLPFFAFSCLSAFTTIWAASSAGKSTPQWFPLITRLILAGHAYIVYLFKMLLPFNLAPLYPYPEKSASISIWNLEYFLGAIMFLLITVSCFWSAKKSKAVLVAWLYYIVTLIPVIGIIHVGPQDTADRYTYLPSLGPFLLFGVGAAIVFEKYSKKIYRLQLIAIFIILIVIMINITTRQIAVWHDSISLWSHEVRVLPTKGYTGYLNRGNAYTSKKEYQSALADYEKAIELSPTVSEIYYLTLYNRGKLYANVEKYQEAIDDFSRVIALGPKYPTVYYMSINNRGSVYGNLGDYESAVKDFDKVVKLNPKYAMAYQNLGTAYYYWGRYQDAIDNYNMVIKLNPQSGDAYYGIGLSYEKLGNRERATDYFNKASRFRK